MNVLVVDDEKAILELTSLMLKSMGLEPITADSAERALDILNDKDIGFVITDFMMPKMNGADLIKEIKARHITIPIVVMSGVGSVDDAVELLRLGADDFLSKPIRRDMLAARLGHVIEKARIYEEARLFRRFVEGSEEEGPEAIITRSPAMLKVIKGLPAMARTDASVLVLGPSGSGKELVARALHRLSRRSSHPFVAVNCGALPENLVESTLFGHRKGAFTGAERDAVGLARAADGGTLFLDEIGDLPLNAQVKLLRFLQQKEVTPVGDTKSVKVDVRVIAATHRDLKKNIADGSFREDLYYRLNVISMELPSLEQRPEDIPVLANHFLVKYAPMYGSSAKAFSTEALSHLVERSWSGNVRELENVVQRALVTCEGPVIELAHVRSLGAQAATPPAVAPQPVAAPPPAPTPRSVPILTAPPLPALSAAAALPPGSLPPFQQAKKDAIDRFEKEYLERLLQQAPRMTDASELAGVDRKGLWRLLKKHGVNSRDPSVELDETADPEAA
jgi:DNA-binding NtrC family response regulator